MKYLMSFLIGFIAVSGFAQIDDELGFIYVKAEYMMETGRYAEAITQFDKIIAKDPSFKESLLNKAEALYETGDYNNAEVTVLDAFHFSGVSSRGIRILGLAQAGSKNFVAAENTLSSGLQLNYKDAELQFAMGELYLAKEDFDKACDSWRNAERMGSDKARLQAMKYCKDQPNKDTAKTPPSGKGRIGKGKIKLPNGKIPTKSSEQNKKDNDDRMEAPPADGRDNVEIEEPKVIEVDKSVRDEEIDENLTLVFKDGIGSREVKRQPDIFILSRESGNVAVKVCLGSDGKVQFAEIMEEASSLTTKSLTSLALRKAKEFIFAKNDEVEEMCGTIDFRFIKM